MEAVALPAKEMVRKEGENCAVSLDAFAPPLLAVIWVFRHRSLTRKGDVFRSKKSEAKEKTVIVD